MLALTMRRTSPRCTVRRATRSWCRICRVAEQLEGLEDCPEDLYLIEGDPQSSMTAYSASTSWKKRWW
jgi:chromosome condensin MukBEF ATPase and DNA-binding subunit MukB